MGELEILERAHRLFGGASAPLHQDSDREHFQRGLQRTADLNTGRGFEGYRLAAHDGRTALRTASGTDTAMAALVADAQRDHHVARQHTGQILQEARADVAVPAVSPLAQREAMRRSAARLRAQHQVVSTTYRRAVRRAALLRRLRYLAQQRRRRGRALPASTTRAAAAVRAALSRLGRPYVWGATGPDRFDCSGLVQWAYHQAGVPLHRTTYDQIHDGIPVPRSHVQPGDLVFPHTGHVQMAIGNGWVVEAPHAGATVRISRLGDAIAIRRPG